MILRLRLSLRVYRNYIHFLKFFLFYVGLHQVVRGRCKKFVIRGRCHAAGGGRGGYGWGGVGGAAGTLATAPLRAGDHQEEGYETAEGSYVPYC